MVCLINYIHKCYGVYQWKNTTLTVSKGNAMIRDQNNAKNF